MKEEILEAIEHFKEALSYRDGNSNTPTISTGDVELALTALKEQFDSLEGCEHCIFEVPFTMPTRGQYSINGIHAEINKGCLNINGYTFSVGNNKVTESIEINYCPNCGRKLRGEEGEYV